MLTFIYHGVLTRPRSFCSRSFWFRPGWLEFVSEGLNTSNQTALVQAAVSEYNAPYDTKTQPVKVYPHSSFRLETPHPSGDKQLYEGVRYAWLCFAANCPWDGGDASPQPPSKATLKTPFKITALRLVAKFQPISYMGAFRSSDPGTVSPFPTTIRFWRQNVPILLGSSAHPPVRRHT